MAEIPSWTKWIVLSLNDYIQTYINTIDPNSYLWFQDTLKPPTPPGDRYEVMYNGPDTRSQTADCNTIHIIVNCQVCTLRTLTNIEKHLMRIGNVKSMLKQCIPTYKYGSDSILDTQEQWYFLQQTSDVMVTTFGTIDPVSTIQRTTVEATYKIVVQE